jgi:RNA polymerase sigma factor for flagellar operon FliA
LVRKIAIIIHKKINFLLELDDLIQAGMLGLLDALEKYKENGNAVFETYAGIRIQGSIMDEIRKNDYLSQEDRSILKKINNFKLKNQGLNKKVTKKEIAEAIGITDKKLIEIESMEINFCSMNESYILDEVESIPNNENTEKVICEKEQKQLLIKEIEKLEEREQIIMGLYYQNECSLKEISLILEISEARVSQLHNEIIKKIKSRLFDLTLC